MESVFLYAFIGAVFVCDCDVIVEASEKLRFVVGNFYVNDKLMGVVVGQQPFGGVWVFGMNDKVGLVWNLLWWTLLCSIKETFVLLINYCYLYMG